MTPEQLEIVKAFQQGRELKLLMAGRNTGKSMFSAQALQRLWNDLYKEQPVEELVLTEGRISGARYHCVQPVGGNWKAMEEWAIATFGEPGEVWPKEQFGWPDNMRWCMNNRKFWFRDEKDRTMFIMRWSR